MPDALSEKFVFKAIFHYQIYSYELTLFLFEQQKVGLFVFFLKSAVGVVLKV